MNNKVDHVFHVWLNSRCGITPGEPKEEPPMRTLYAWKSAMQFLGWAPGAIKRAREGRLRTVHQHCSHCAPEPITDNVLKCWLGEDVARCPILCDLAMRFDEERNRLARDGKPGYYADITDDEMYEVMGMVCAWHLLMSDIAAEVDKLPKAAFVDWNEGAFQDKSDRMFWERVYDSMTTDETE